MDTLRQAILNVIQDYLDYLDNNDPETQLQIIADETNHHYFLFEIGWNGYRRIYGPIIHLNIIDNKIWIQHDGTEQGIATELLAQGIEKQQIVLAFKCLERRQITDFAVA